MHQISGKFLTKNKEVHLCFIDLENRLTQSAESMFGKYCIKGANIVGREQTVILMLLYKNNRNIGRFNNKESRKFESQMGMRQDCVLYHLLFSVVLDEAMTKACAKMKKLSLGVSKLKETPLKLLMFADDIVILANTEKTLQHT